MKKCLTRSLPCLSLALAFLVAGTAAYGVDAAAFNPVPVSVQASVIGGGVPVGAVVAWPVAVNPTDAEFWLECNGQPTDGYPELAAVVGTNVPDLRGRFLRGLGGNSAALGVAQGDAIRNITGRVYTDRNSWMSSYPSNGAFYSVTGGDGNGTESHPTQAYMIYMDASRQVPTANENRPVNMAVRYLIRARP